MNIAALSSATNANLASLYSRIGAADKADVNTAQKPAASSAGNSAADIKKASSQFEAIILRQLLAPSIQPIMSGGTGESESAGSGVYAYMLTDALADNLSKGGGMGLAKILEKQLTPHSAKADITTSSALLRPTSSS